jgi:type IV pilus assembly protein PilY1
MKRSKYLSVSFAIVVGFAAGVGSGMPTQLQADDTEIYLGAASVSAGIRPNVLMILDTSGSMSTSVSGTGMDRMDNMKVAMKKIIDGVNNVNIGLMRFSDPGGPILYPVSYIDEDVSKITKDPNSADINVRIDQGIDDAEQIDCNVNGLLGSWDCTNPTLGKVSLDSPVLDSVRTVGAPSAGGNSFEAQVDADSDDAEQDATGGLGMSLGSSDLEMAYDGGLQVAGMRFRNVAIPQGATILSAELEFVADESHSDIGFTLRIQGEATDDANTYTTTAGDISGRPTTVAFTDWVDPEPWTATDIYQSPDITAIVQEIINRPGWVPDNEMAFVIQYAPGSATGSNLKRVAYSHNRDSDRAPRLRIDWTTEKTNPENQWVGLRFNNVGVPQGAKIESAYIEFVPTQDDAGDLEVEISAYDIGNMPEFTNVDYGLFAVPTTLGFRSQTWTADPWTAGVSAQTTDIKDLVQHVVDRGDWCGNNSMGFLMGLKDSNTKHGPRVGYSFDSNPTNAPILRINYDESTAGTGCIDQWVQRQIQGQSDDAEEALAAGTIDLASTDLDFDNQKMSGMRFTDIPVTKGQKILEARIVFTADAAESGGTTLRFKGEKGADAATFEDVANGLSSRAKTTASVDWVAPDQTAGVQYRSPDLAAVVQEIVDGSGWLPGNAIALFEEHVSGGARRAMSWDRDKLKSPILLLKIQGPLATTGAGQRTVRTELKEIIDGLDHNGHTPIVDTLYEAALYYAGKDVLYGLTRGWDRDSTFQPNPNSGSSNPKVRRNTRVSHPGSWIGGGGIDQPGDCSDDDPNHTDCIYEKIKNSPTATYKSPIESNCQSNFIILLTDGIANHNHSEDVIKAFTGDTSCAGGNGEQACGHELVKFIHDEDQSPVPGKQNVITYTIGFNFSSKWLVDMAALGGGKFHEAKDADQLTREVTQIFSDILNRSTSFAAPTLSVNAFNKLFHRSDVYFSLFKPSSSVRWEGNLKKYQLCPSTDPANTAAWPKDKSGTPKACTDLGEVLDVNADPAVVKDPLNPDLGRIEDTAESFWSGVQDGSEIKVGGSGLEIPAPANRRVLTYTGTAAPSYTPLDNDTHRVASAGGGKGVFKGLTGTATEKEQRTQVLFGDLAFASTDDDREEWMDWMLGTDPDGLEDVASLAAAGRRFAFHDPLHSSAVAITFGGTEAEPMIKLFVGTNDGGLRAINAANGVEEWTFYPQTTLANQPALRDNFAGKHIYGIDGTPSVWMNDINKNGIIEAGTDLNSNGYIEENEGDFVRLIIGMRRGGRNVYAVDVTPGSPQSTGYTVTAGQQTNDIPPTYMWRIDGGAGNYSNLGQTWSKPQVTKINFGTSTLNGSTERTTMVMSGGYDDFQDGGFGVGGNGNGIYFVNPYTGAMDFVISGTDHGISNQLIVPGMDYPIPSDLALIRNAAGVTERMYVCDTGGNLWRIDLHPDLAAGSASIKPVVGKLATVSNNVHPLDKRKIFYPPDVVHVPSGKIPGVAEHDLVVLTTGNRSHPLDETVQDRIYAFRDMVVGQMADTDFDGLADSYTTLQGALQDPSLTGDLMNVTDIVDFTVTVNMDALKAAEGWYIDLEGVGEKGLAAPVILDGRIFFTTYVPEKVIDPTQCSIQEGAGKLYQIDVLDGSAVQNWDGVGDDNNLTKSDRTYGLGSGIPSQAVPIFQPEGITLLIGGGGGATSVDPNIALPRVRTYWGQEE